MQGTGATLNGIKSRLKPVPPAILGPDRGDNLFSIFENLALTYGAEKAGSIPIRPDRLPLGENGAGEFYAKDWVEGKLANSGLGVAVKVGAELKWGYDLGSYAVGYVTCWIWGR
jgi:hypothetical protein